MARSQVFFHWEEARLALQGQGSVVTLGTFDGVHLGHQRLLERALQVAKARNLAPLFFTFDRHPLALLCPEKAPLLLSSVEEKIKYLQEFEPEILVVQEFTHAFAELAPEEFIRQVLVGLGAKYIVVGFNNTFGQGGRGTPHLLQEAGRFHHFTVEIVPPVKIGGEVVRSTLIRQFLQQGRVEEAATLLGHPYLLTGTVVRGAGRGHRYGFPTANISFPSAKLCPAQGVYAVVARWGEHRQKGLAAISTQPTFGGQSLTLEVHLPAFTGDLYGQRLEVLFQQRLRDIIRFSSSEALAEQIRRDLAVLANLKDG